MTTGARREDDEAGEGDAEKPEDERQEEDAEGSTLSASDGVEVVQGTLLDADCTEEAWMRERM